MMPNDRSFRYTPKQPAIVVEFVFDAPMTGNCFHTLLSQSNPQDTVATPVRSARSFSVAFCPPTEREDARLTVTLELVPAQ